MWRCVSILDIRVPEIAPEADEDRVEIIAEHLAYQSTGYFAFEDIGEGLRMARNVFVRFRKIE